MKRAICIILYLTALITAISSSGVASEVGAYRIERVCQLSQNNSRVTDINNSGQVVGWTESSPQHYSSFIWEQGILQSLGSLGGDTTVANAINDRGQVTGYSTFSSTGWEETFVWENGSMTPRRDLGGANSFGSDINEDGVIAGYSQFDVWGQGHAFTNTNDVPLDLGTLGGGLSCGKGINDTGEVVGYSHSTGTTDARAFIKRNGEMTDLGTLGGPTSYALRINNAGQVVGYSYLSGNVYRHAFLWQNGRMEDLGESVSQYSWAWDINNNGLIVGNYGWYYHACMWKDSVLIDLNDLLPSNSSWVLTDATAVNDLGQIVGKGLYNGEYSGFLMTPVPEPSSVLVLLCGVGALAAARRRKWDRTLD